MISAIQKHRKLQKGPDNEEGGAFFVRLFYLLKMVHFHMILFIKMLLVGVYVIYFTLDFVILQ